MSATTSNIGGGGNKCKYDIYVFFCSHIYTLIGLFAALSDMDISAAPVDVSRVKTETNNIVPITSMDAVLL